MLKPIRRVVTGHDATGRSVVLSDAAPPQNHPMHGEAIGADFHEVWAARDAVPVLGSQPDAEPNDWPFRIMPETGHLLRILDVYPLSAGGQRTAMHRTRTLDYVVVIEGELVLILSDSEVTLRPGDVVVQRGTDHAWENRSSKVARAAYFHTAAQFSAELLNRLPKPLPVLGE